MPGDPVMRRRRAVERWTLLANRVGYLVLAFSVALFAFLSVVLYFGIDLVLRVRFQTFASMDISMGWAYAALPAGALLGVIAVIAHHLDPHDDELSTAQ